jgi:hypothetical protein
MPAKISHPNLKLTDKWLKRSRSEAGFVLPLHSSFEDGKTK